ncbi:DUF6225 family protein [Streptomyces gelaticus]|uniref:DUF6225 family protein n=1 Tax=Streptomyces gelaticus TaxID=285446 RepID=UPI0037AF49B1
MERRATLKDLPDDTPIHIGVAEDLGDFGGYRESVLVDAHHVENWWPATGTTPERAEKEKARSPSLPTGRPESTTCSIEPANPRCRR